MVKCGDWPVGVCSWSLRTDITGVAEAMSKLGIEHVHLAVRPALEEDGNEYLVAVRRQKWTISSTMIDFPQEDYSTLESIKRTGGIAPDEYWERNRELFMGAVEATEQLGVKYVSMHAGFIDTTQAEYARKFHDRIRHLADAAAKKQIILLMETGQESAEELREFLQQLNHPFVGVNFDPANMILYNKDEPGEAVRILAPWIRHVHIKDAIRTKRAGTWGTEVRWGEGQVGGESFLKALEEIGYEGALAVEREAGDDRFGDIRLAVERLSRFEKQS
ncbi:MAG TPA: sugar phosphate isomerase/epimerase family protein [Sedimentisphaerales bacterium]|nr:sugar phosphate isomerase/epimerase family protein [Sedimentisphaerales bacterium]